VATQVESSVTTAVKSTTSWWDERTGWSSFVNAVFRRQVPSGLSWWYSLGAATLFVFVLQLVTGILLSLNYAPTPDTAYDSVLFINSQVPFGWYIRGLHHWGASAMVVLVVAHMVSAFVLGAHRAPREVTWGIGVCLLLITLAFGFTGYLLPWDQKAYWATTVGTNMAGTVPLIGSALMRVLRGGADVGAVTLTQFYSIHVLILPLFPLSLVLAHLALVIYHGVSVPPRHLGSSQRYVRRALQTREGARSVFLAGSDRGRPATVRLHFHHSGRPHGGCEPLAGGSR